jgi:hypothetical protein
VQASHDPFSHPLGVLLFYFILFYFISRISSIRDKVWGLARHQGLPIKLIKLAASTLFTSNFQIILLFRGIPAGWERKGREPLLQNPSIFSESFTLDLFDFFL